MKREDLSFRIVDVAHKHRCVMERLFNSTGVFQGQHKMLMCISDNDFYSQKEIAGHMKISTATVAVSLKKLSSIFLLSSLCPFSFSLFLKK